VKEEKGRLLKREGALLGEKRMSETKLPKCLRKEGKKGKGSSIKTRDERRGEGALSRSFLFFPKGGCRLLRKKEEEAFFFWGRKKKEEKENRSSRGGRKTTSIGNKKKNNFLSSEKRKEVGERIVAHHEKTRALGRSRGGREKVVFRLRRRGGGKPFSFLKPRTVANEKREEENPHPR